SRYIFPFVAAAVAMSVIALSYLTNSFVDKPYLGGFCIYLGRISYSVYLFYIMLILLLRPSLQHLPLLVQLCIYVAGCAILLQHFLPVLRKADSRCAPEVQAGPIAGVGLFGAASSVPGRYRRRGHADRGARAGGRPQGGLILRGAPHGSARRPRRALRAARNA